MDHCNNVTDQRDRLTRRPRDSVIAVALSSEVNPEKQGFRGKACTAVTSVYRDELDPDTVLYIRCKDAVLGLAMCVKQLNDKFSFTPT